MMKISVEVVGDFYRHAHDASSNHLRASLLPSFFFINKNKKHKFGLQRIELATPNTCGNPKVIPDHSVTGDFSFLLPTVILFDRTDASSSSLFAGESPSHHDRRFGTRFRRLYGRKKIWVCPKFQKKHIILIFKMNQHEKSKLFIISKFSKITKL